jgi:hypothetical protein
MKNEQPSTVQPTAGDIINKILETDEEARAITEAAERERESRRGDIEKEKSALKQRYLKQAEQEAEGLKAAAEKKAAERVENKRREADGQIERLNKIFEQKRAEFAEEIFKRTLAD